MALRVLELVNFRTYRRAKFEFGPGLNLLLGANGVGKTNLLEATYTLANTRSWRASDSDLIYHGQGQWRLTGHLANQQLRINYQSPPRPTKQLLVNQTRSTTRHYLPHLATVLFEPGHLNIVGGSPSARRDWLDQALATRDPQYLLALLKLRRILHQRNTLLKNLGRRVDATHHLFSWNVGLSEQADYLVKRRQQFAAYLNRQLTARYQLLAGSSPRLQLTYRLIELGEENDYPSSLLAALERLQTRDQLLGATTVGPHRDDLVISWNDQLASRVASRGEVRTIVLALKLLEAEWLTKAGQKPVILFDDVFSELDQVRQAKVLAALTGYQIFITTTDLKGLKSKLPTRHRLFNLPVPPS